MASQPRKWPHTPYNTAYVRSRVRDAVINTSHPAFSLTPSPVKGTLLPAPGLVGVGGVPVPALPDGAVPFPAMRHALGIFGC